MKYMSNARSLRRSNIAIVTFTSELNKLVPQTFIDSLVRIVSPSADRIFVLAAISPSFDDEKIVPIMIKKYGDKEREFILLKLLHYVLTDIKLSLKLLSISRDVDVVIYHVRVYLLATLVAKLLRKKIAVFSFNPAAKSANISFSKRTMVTDGALPGFVFGWLEKAVFSLANRIWIESKSVLDFAELSRYRERIFICGDAFIDVERFSVQREPRERETIVGYIGRFEKTKGVLNLVRAVPLILAQHSNVQFFFGGGGSLWHSVAGELKGSKLQQKVKLAGWISQDELPYYLNQIKLFILPSETEGLPRAIMEAMACGAVVLATPVGGVPDLIKDGATGFILENNSPECITKNIVRALEHPTLDGIAKNARDLIKREYSYKVMVERCQAAIDDLYGRY